MELAKFPFSFRPECVVAKHIAGLDKAINLWLAKVGKVGPDPLSARASRQPSSSGYHHQGGTRRCHVPVDPPQRMARQQGRSPTGL
jgi:hypothetical protein